MLTFLDEGVVHVFYSKCNPFVMDGGIVCNPRQRIELLGSFCKKLFQFGFECFLHQAQAQTEELSEVFARVAVFELQTSRAMRNRNGSEGHKVNVCLLICSFISYHY